MTRKMLQQDGRDLRAEAADLPLALYRSLGAVPAFQPFLADLAHVLHAGQAGIVFETRHGAHIETLRFAIPDDDAAAPLPVDEAEGRALALVVRLQQDLDVTLWVRRSDAADAPFGVAERAVLDGLSGELGTACRIFARYSASERERRVYRKALDRLGMGVLLVDASLRLMASNGVGESLLGSGAGLTLAHGRLRLGTPAATQRLERAVGHATARQYDPAGQHGEPLLIPCAKAGPPLTAFVFPGPQPFGVVGVLMRSAVILVAEPGRKSGIGADDIMPLFGLTRAEATLAIRLADGESVTEAAESLGISRNTARAQLNAVFQKTGAVRQSELVRQILGSAAVCVLAGRDARLPPATGERLALD